MKLPETAPSVRAMQAGGRKIVTLGMPHHGPFEPEFETSRTQMELFSFQHGFSFVETRYGGSDIEVQRWRIVRDEFQGEYLFFVDADQQFPQHTLVRLARHNVPIVGTLVTLKKPPFQVCSAYGTVKEGFNPIIDWPENALIEVDVTGFGCCLIKREVFEKMPDGNPFRKLWRSDEDGYIGEDWSFCLRAKELGFPIYVDTSIEVGHIGKYIYTVRDYAPFRRKYIQIMKDGGAKYMEKALHPKVVRWLGEQIMFTEEGKLAEPTAKLMGENGKTPVGVRSGHQ